MPQIESRYWKLSPKCSLPKGNGKGKGKVRHNHNRKILLAEMHTMHLVNALKVVIRMCRSEIGLTSTIIDCLAIASRHDKYLFGLLQEAARRGDIMIWPPSSHEALAVAFEKHGHAAHAAAARLLLTARAVREVLES